MIFFDHFLIVKSIVTQLRWLSLDPKSALARYSPNNSDGRFFLINIFALDIVYVLAWIGHWHGKPYCARYFGQKWAHISQALP